MRRLTICIVLTLSLVPAGVAAAKKPVSAKICGPSDCRTVKDSDSLMALTEGGPPSDPPQHGSGWYSVRMTIQTGPDQHERFSMAIVPGAGLLRGGDASAGYAWMEATPRGLREYRRVTRGLAPFPARELKAVGPPAARVDEVVLPPEQPKRDGRSSPLPWIGGGLALLGLAGGLVRWRGLRWPRPAQS
jgi:hypothetical protein